MIALAGLLAYWTSLSIPFHYDDGVAIVKNPQIRRLWPLADALSPLNGGTPVSGRPLVNLSFAINYAIGGLDVYGYHVTNVAIHVVCALVLFGIVRRTLGSAGLVSRFGADAPWIALAVALIWLLHPLQTETVNYLSARTESLMGVFHLLTLYCSIRAGRATGFNRWSSVAVVLCLLGMACKESMATAPILVMLYDRAFLFDSFKEAFRTRRLLYLGLAASWMALVWLNWSGPRSASAGFSTGITTWTYLLNQAVIIPQYLRRAIWPSSLVFDYGEPVPLAAGDVGWPLVLLSTLAAMALVAWFLRPGIGFLGVWFFVTLAPSSSLVPIATEVGADRRMYLPLAGLVTLGVVLLYLLCEQWALRRSRPRLAGLTPKVAMVMAAAAVCVALTVATVRRHRDYASGLTLWQSVLDRWPSARAHRNLATELVKAGRREEAVLHIRQTLDAHPEARYLLGFELFEQGRLDEAIVELGEFIRLVPKDREIVSARHLLARALLAEERTAEAAEQFRSILASTPGDENAHLALAKLLISREDLAGAERQYRELLSRRPDSVPGWNGLASVLASTDRTSEAADAFTHALAVDPRDAYAHASLASIQIGSRDYEGALVHAQQALRTNPRDSFAHHMLALALLGQGRLDEAIAHLRESVALDETNAEAQQHLALALKLKAGS